MYVYILLFALMLILGLMIFEKGQTENRKKIYSLLFFSSICMIECVRDVSIGEDTINYVGWFEDFCYDGWRNSFLTPRRYVEPGFKMLNLLVSEFTNNYHFFVAIVALIIVGLFTWFLKENSEDVFLSTMLFFGLNFFVNSMTAFRQFIAMGIVFWMLPLLLKEKWSKAILVGMIAFSFHRSSIIYILCVLGLAMFKSEKRMLKIAIIGEIMILMALPLCVRLFLWLQPKYEIYFIYGEVASMGKLRMVYIIIEFMLVIHYLYFRKEIHNRQNHFIVIMISLSILIGILNAYIPHIFRLGYYFDFYMLLFVPILIPKKIIINRIFWKFTTISASFMLFIYYLSTNAGGVVPYKIF